MNNPLELQYQQRTEDAANGTYRMISYKKAGQRATVTISRPEVYNCFNYLTLLELADAFHDAARDTSIGVVVMTGSGDKAFCTGADLREQRDTLVPNPQLYYTWMGAFIDVHERLRNIGKPTIARLNGITVGGGNEFNMACDLAIAADHTYIKHVGPMHGSTPAGGATQWLPLFVGDRRAREIIWTGREIDAETALDWGLVNSVVPLAGLDSAVDSMVDTLLKTLPETMRYTRTQTNYFKDLSWYGTIHHARDWLALHTNAPEVHAAIRGFTDKAPTDYRQIRENFGTPRGAYAWGAPSQSCTDCGASKLPEGFTHCGQCGSELAAQAAPTHHTTT